MFDRESLIAFEPRTCRRRVPTCGIVWVRAVRFKGTYTRDEIRARGIVVAPYNDCCTQAMGDNVFRIVRKHAVDLNERVAVTCKHELKRAVTPRVQIKISFVCGGLCVMGHS